MTDPYGEGIWWLCYAVGDNLLAFYLGPLVPSEGRVTENQYKDIVSNHLSPVMELFLS